MVGSTLVALVVGVAAGLIAGLLVQRAPSRVGGRVLLVVSGVTLLLAAISALAVRSM